MNTAHHRKAIQAFVMAFSYLSSVLSTTDFGCLRLMRRRREAHLYTQSEKGKKKAMHFDASVSWFHLVYQ